MPEESRFVTQPFRSNRVLQGLVLWLVPVWIVTVVKPLYPRGWLHRMHVVLLTLSIVAVLGAVAGSNGYHF